ncbi:MAG: PAS domain-containing protein [Thermodesulfobacteriota bacterium]
MARKFEDKFNALEERYKLIADNLIDAIWVLDVEDQTFDFITQSVQRLSGYTAEEYCQLTMAQWLGPESYANLLAILREELAMFEQGQARKRILDVEMIHKDGHSYWVEISAKVFKDESGRFKVVGLSKDITSRRAAEQEREKLVRQLGQALAEKERLLKEVKTLRGLLPICAACKRIRDEHGQWWPLDAYIEHKSDASLTHTICPDCSQVLYHQRLEP